MSLPYIIQVIGYSQSGKTTLITELVKLLKKENISSLTIKSARSHPYEYSTKDSDKFLESGAQTSVVIFSNVTQISSNQQLNVEVVIEASEKLSDFDIVLIEGFKELKYPKILVFSEKIPDTTEIDFMTIRYLYSPEEKEFDKSTIVNDLIKQSNVFLAFSIEELTSKIIFDLESRG